MVNPTLAEPKVESRGVWIEFLSRSWGRVDQVQVDEMVKALSDNHFNMILPLTREYTGGVLYKSKYAYSSQPELLKQLVQTAHQRKMQVHAWMPVLIAGFNLPDKILLDHPSWAVVNKQGKSCLQEPISGNYWWYDPSNPEVREYLTNLVREIAQQRVDGINLDWLRINDEWTYSSTFRSGFKSKYDIDPIEINSAEQRENWHQYRVDIVTSLARQLRDTAKSVNPRIKVSAAVAPNPIECKRDRFQDWLQWTEFLDFIYPMLYRSPDESIVTQSKSIIGQSKCPIYIGLGGDEGVNLPASGWVDLIKLVRDSGAKGFSIYRYEPPDRNSYLNQTDLEVLRFTVLTKPARIH